MLTTWRILLVLLVLSAAACKDDDGDGHKRDYHPIFGGDGAVSQDAGALSDAGAGFDSSVADAALAEGGTPVNDASAPAQDAGSPGVDGSVPALDAASGDAGPGDAASGDSAISSDAAADASPADAAVPQDSGPPAAPGPSLARTVTVGGAARTFLLYIPKSAVKTMPAPLVSVHHGFTMTGKIMEEITTWKKIAEREAIVVAFLDGLDPPWNVGENVCGLGSLVGAGPEQDDIGFVKAVIDSADKDQTIKRDAVFVGGFSMGGYFANHAACKARDFVRAASGHSSGTFSGTCPGQPIPMLLIHGDADGLIDYTCGAEARGFWVERNGCSTQTTTEQVKGGSCAWNTGCPAGREVGLCTMVGMDHGWAGAPTSGPGAWLSAAFGVNGNLDYGGGVEYEDAAEMMWKFFKKYR